MKRFPFRNFACSFFLASGDLSSADYLCKEIRLIWLRTVRHSDSVPPITKVNWERSGLVVRCLTREKGATDSSLTSFTVCVLEQEH